MARRGFISALNAVAREAARQQRRIEAERRRQERARLQYQRQMERAQRLKDKEDKQRYIEERLEETEERNAEVTERLEALQTVLEYTLAVDDTISFESLRIQERFTPAPVPHELATPQPPPNKQTFLSRVKAPSLLARIIHQPAS
jgi:restriction system protein